MIPIQTFTQVRDESYLIRYGISNTRNNSSTELINVILTTTEVICSIVDTTINKSREVASLYKCVTKIRIDSVSVSTKRSQYTRHCSHELIQIKVICITITKLNCYCKIVIKVITNLRSNLESLIRFI